MCWRRIGSFDVSDIEDVVGPAAGAGAGAGVDVAVAVVVDWDYICRNSEGRY